MGRKKITPLRAIKAYCFVCSGGWREIKKCENAKCPLYVYRNGKNPARKGIYSRKSLSNLKTTKN